MKKKNGWAAFGVAVVPFVVLLFVNPPMAEGYGIGMCWAWLVSIVWTSKF